MKKLILALTLLASLSAYSVEIEMREYSGGKDLSSLLMSGAPALANKNCIRNIVHNHTHQVQVSMGCYLEKVTIEKSKHSNDGKDIDVSPLYRCERINWQSTTTYSCRLK